MNESSACIVFTDAAIKRGDRTIWQHGNFTIPTGSVTAIAVSYTHLTLPTKRIV